MSFPKFRQPKLLDTDTIFDKINNHLANIYMPQKDEGDMRKPRINHKTRDDAAQTVIVRTLRLRVERWVHESGLNLADFTTWDDFTGTMEYKPTGTLIYQTISKSELDSLLFPINKGT